MKLRLLAVASAALFFYTMFIFHPPVFLTVGILLPSILLSVYLLTAYYNAAVSGNFNSVVPAREGDRLQKLNSDVTLMQSLHFQKVDAFLVPTIPDSLALVFMHPSEPILAIVRLFEHKKTWEFITFLDGSDLATGSDAGSGNAPRSARHPLQIFLNSDPVSLLGEHREAVRFLEARGNRPRNLPVSAVRKALLFREKELIGHLRSFPLWPFRLLLWTVRKQGLHLTVPLKDRQELNRILPAKAAGQSGDTAASPEIQRYRVLFRGAVREGFTVPEVKDTLSRKFRLDAAKTDTLFAGSPVLIRSDADEATARKVKDAFYRAGALCILEDQPAAAVTPDATADPVAAAPGAVDRSESGEDREFQKFQIQRLLAADRSALEKDFKAFETPGWSAYALALSSFLPVLGIAGGAVSILYGLSKRKKGGMKVAIIGFAGLIFTLLGGVSDFYVKMKRQAGVFDTQPVQKTKKRLNGLVRGLERYHEQNDRYPESLILIQEQSDTAVSILDPMDLRQPDENPRQLVYEQDPSGRSYRLYSAGADGVPGTQDDIFPGLPPDELAGTGYRR